MTDRRPLLIDGVRGSAIDGLDRGLHYGDGLFETLKVRAGTPLFWELHMARLAAGCARLRIPMPSPDLLHAEAEQLCAGRGAGALKLVLTRGSAGRGYRPPAEPVPMRLLGFFDLPRWPADRWEFGVAVCYCETPLSCNPALAGLKHLNRLEQVLAQMEFDPEVHAEGLMRGPDGDVIEGTMTNLFIVRNREVTTPPISACGVAGIARARVIGACVRLGVPCRESTVRPDDIAAADEIFLTNSLIGLWPVREIEGRAYRAGPITRRLAAALAEQEAALG